jgi:hypothetical protein
MGKQAFSGRQSRRRRAMQRTGKQSSVKTLIHRLFALPQFAADLQRFIQSDFIVR